MGARPAWALTACRGGPGDQMEEGMGVKGGEKEGWG